MPHILSIAFCFLSLSLFAQPNPKIYSAFENKTVVFKDNFDDDRNGWISGYFDSCYYREPGDTSTIQDFERATIANGKLLMSEKSNYKNQFRPYHTYTAVNFNKNHEIEFVLNIEGEKNRSNTAVIYWGCPCNSLNGYNIYVTAEGKIYFFYGNENIKKYVSKNIHKSYNSKAFTKNVSNKVTVRKHNNIYYLFINEQLEAELPFTSLEGNIFAFGKSFNNTVSFDYVKISHIEYQYNKAP